MEGAKGNTSNIHLCDVVLLEPFIDFISDTVCSLVAHCVLFTFQRRRSLDLHCFSYNFPKQVMFIKVRARMKGCQVTPLHLLKVCILQKSYKGFLHFALTWESTLFNFGCLTWRFVGTPGPPGAPAVCFTAVVLSVPSPKPSASQCCRD